MDKKLTLKKETLKRLSVEQLRNVAGGGADPTADPGAPLVLSAADSLACNVL